MEHIFHRKQIEPLMVEGDSFHRFNRDEMDEAIASYEARGQYLSHFGPDSNLFDKLEQLFKTYGRCGGGEFRRYTHNEDEAEANTHAPGTFTPWTPTRLTRLWPVISRPRTKAQS